MCNWGCVVGESGVCSRQRAGVEGLLPLLHLGSVFKFGAQPVVPFRGTFDHTLDAKNRLTVPARYRAALAEGVVLARPVDLKPCVGVWHPEEYERYSRRALAELLPLSPRLTELERFFYGNSQDADLDAAWRIMVPSFLSEHAELVKDVKVVGAGDRLELWSKDGWDQHQKALLEGVKEITAHVDDTA